MSQAAELNVNLQQNILHCSGEWTKDNIRALQQQSASLKTAHLSALKIEAGTLAQLDTAGAWFLIKLCRELCPDQEQLVFSTISAEHRALIELIYQQSKKIQTLASPKAMMWVARLGERTVQGLAQVLMFLAFIGEAAIYCFGWLKHPSRIQWKLLFNIVESSGYRALPITGLLAFLIGIVLTYQMGLQLRNYGANIYIVNLVGLAMLREFAPLITAIIIAGRSGSAFTAQLGTMKVNQEMDALRTMGISPIERLVLQRILGLIIAMPLLTVWSDILGVFGGMVMSFHMLDIHYYDFIVRFQEVVQLKTLLIGVLKAPVFAMIIAGVGCFQGFQVTGSAASVGQLTTRSVVQAIFLIIAADAFFSVLLSWYDL